MKTSLTWLTTILPLLPDPMARAMAYEAFLMMNLLF
jgi:hypothetical protein